ncbi:MAG TPA: S8 family serine peptidase [Burkholderiaceae bacterium]|nr:S8 family serine peptidase [Burkholderiaceae bacterium]
MHPSRFLLLPPVGFATGRFASPESTRLLKRLVPAEAPIQTLGGLQVRVLASAASDGTKVLELGADQAALLQAQAPGLRLVPERRYLPARAPRLRVLHRLRAREGMELAPVTIRVTAGEGEDGRPLSDCLVVVLTDVATGTGVEGTTNARGELRVRLPQGLRRLPLVAAYPLHGGWPREWRRLAVEGTQMALALPPLDVRFADSRRRLYQLPGESHGQGVRVAVIDTGVGPHGALPVALGRNTTLVEPTDAWHDEDGHGTHVAGVIAARARSGAPGLFWGEAAQVQLHAYRVFEHGEPGASNAAIREAIRQAVLDGCDILNLSLGGGESDPAISEAIQFARLSGAVCIVAAGNDGGPVSFPASDPMALAVSAIGVKQAWPAHAATAGHAGPPEGRHDAFFARFSNRGPQVRLCAPGVGIISTIPGDRYGVMDGTSMASPVAAGVLARVLALAPQVLQAPRDARRSEAILTLAARCAEDLGMPATMQGKGLAR